LCRRRPIVSNRRRSFSSRSPDYHRARGLVPELVLAFALTLALAPRTAAGGSSIAVWGGARAAWPPVSAAISLNLYNARPPAIQSSRSIKRSERVSPALARVGPLSSWGRPHRLACVEPCRQSVVCARGAQVALVFVSSRHELTSVGARERSQVPAAVRPADGVVSRRRRTTTAHLSPSFQICPGGSELLWPARWRRRRCPPLRET
jgi:hypothetical protein